MISDEELAEIVKVADIQWDGKPVIRLVEEYRKLRDAASGSASSEGSEASMSPSEAPPLDTRP